MIVVVCLLAVIFITYPYQGRPLSEWPYKLSINAIISMLFAVLKSAMLVVTAEGLSQLKWIWFQNKRPLGDLKSYDMASRGPLGSLRLLWALRGRDCIATVGAIITVLAIASDAFAQQVVRYYPCSYSTPSAQASVPRTSIYDETAWRKSSDSFLCPVGLQGAVGAGLYNSAPMQGHDGYAPTESKVPFGCPTGQCSFPKNYHSIAYCSSCIDITSQVTVTPLKVITADVSAEDSYRYPYTASSFTLPSGQSIFVNDTINGSPQVTVTQNEWLVFNTEGNWQPFTFPNASDQCQTFGCNGYGAASCLIVPCIKTYNGSVHQGSLTETWRESFSPIEDNGQLSSGLFADAVLNVDCLSKADRQAVSLAGVGISHGIKWLPYSLDVGNFKLYEDSLVGNISQQCVYGMRDLVSVAVQDFAMSYFDGELVPPVEDDDSGFFGDAATGPPQLEMLYEKLTFAGISDAMRHVTNAMTNYVLQWSVEGAQGQVTYDVTCVNIRYAWLTFPAALVLLMIAFFVSMVWKTRRSDHHSHDWKSSPLALMYHGLEDDVLERKSSHNLDRTSAMTANASLLHAKLSRTEKGWRFVEV